MRAKVEGTFLGLTLKKEKWAIGQVLQNGADRAELVEVLVFADVFDRFPDALKGKLVSLPCRVSIRADKRGESRLSCVVLSRELPAAAR